MKRRRVKKASPARRTRMEVDEFFRRRRMGEELSIDQYLSEESRQNLSLKKREELRDLLMVAEPLHRYLDRHRRIRFKGIYRKLQFLRKLDPVSRAYYIHHPEKLS